MIPDKIDKLKEDETYPSFLSVEYANQLVSIVNALRRLEVPGGKVTWSDSNVVINFSGSGGSGNTPTTGSGNTFVSSSIFCLAKWS
jgi:hypothetical protein